MFASAIEEPARRSGLSLWFAAAGALVIGILIGFASGYRAGQGSNGSAAIEPGLTRPAPASTSGASSPGQTFSESAVSEPVRLNPEPIVPAPESAGSAPRDRNPARNPVHTTAAGQVPPPSSKKAVGRVPPPTGATGGEPAIPATGPGSLQIVTRPAGAQVIMDGRSIGKTPMSIPDVPAGDHSIRLELSGFKPWSTTADVKAGNTTRVAASLEQ
jgi:hypothetical protein